MSLYVNKRFGRFTIGKGYLWDNYDLILEAFSRLRVLPIRIEENLMMETFEYWAFSEAFDIIDIGESLHEYSLIIEEGESGRIYEFRKL